MMIYYITFDNKIEKIHLYKRVRSVRLIFMISLDFIHCGAKESEHESN
jgi:hypothetical protein